MKGVCKQTVAGAERMTHLTGLNKIFDCFLRCAHFSVIKNISLILNVI